MLFTVDLHRPLEFFGDRKFVHFLANLIVGVGASKQVYPLLRLNVAIAPAACDLVALKQRIESRTAFMALKFDQAAVERMVQECVRAAVKRTGFELRILTDQQGAGLIDNKIRAGLLAARFVISDLTYGSHGAYWEAGFGEGRGIPVIYTCERAEWEKNKTHFDTNHMGTIIWDKADLKKAEDALVAMIRATLRAEAKQTDDDAVVPPHVGLRSKSRSFAKFAAMRLASSNVPE
jgi:hypothetical protein